MLRHTLLLLLSLTLLGCTGGWRARTPAELVGLRSSSSNFRWEMEERASDEITDPCHYQLMLQNALLKQQLENCNQTPAATQVEVPVEIPAVKLQVVPAEPTSSLPSDFPPPMERALTRVACPPPPR